LKKKKKKGNGLHNPFPKKKSMASGEEGEGG